MVQKTCGDFDILHGSFDLSASANTIFNSDLEKLPILSLYVIRKDTREVSFFDVNIEELSTMLKKNSLKNILDREAKHAKKKGEAEPTLEKRTLHSSPDASKKDLEQFELAQRYLSDNWYIKLFKPSQTKDISTNRPNSSIQLATATTSTRSNWQYYHVVGWKNLDKCHVIQYPCIRPGTYVNEVLEWDYWINRTASGEFWGTLAITNQYTDSDIDMYDNPNFAPITLGKASNPIKASLSLNGSGSSSNPWGDTIGVVQSGGTMTSDVTNPKNFIRSVVRRKPSWENALYSLADIFLADKKVVLNSSAVTIAPPSGSNRTKVYSSELQDRRMGTPGQQWWIKVSLEYPINATGKGILRYNVNFPIYSANGWGLYTDYEDSRNLSITRSY